MKTKDCMVTSLILLLTLFPEFARTESAVPYIDVHTHLVTGDLPTGIGGRRPDGGQSQGNGPSLHPEIIPLELGQRGPGGRQPPQGRQQGRGDGPSSGGYEGYVAAADRMISHMDKLGVRYAVVMSPPKTAENQSPSIDHANFLKAISRYPERLLPGGGGESLNPIIHSTDPASVSEAVLTKFDEAVAEIVRQKAKCFGEMAVLHLSYSEHHVFEQCAPDHPLFLRLADASAKHGIPIDLHMDCVPTDTFTPPMWRKMSPKNPDSLKANIPGLERLLEHNTKAKIVWQHVGRDTLGKLTPGLLRDLLSKHPNLYCALWSRHEDMPADNGPPGPNQITDKDYKVKEDWLQLFKDFPDRFMIGTDGFFPGKSDKLDTSIEGTWKFVGLLPQELRNKIGGENAARVYGIQAPALKP